MGKIVVIGATGTIGKAAVAALGQGHDIIAVGASRGEHRVDATDPHSVTALFQSLGPVDGIVAAFGGVHFGPFAQMTPEHFAHGLHDKLMGQVNVVLLGQPWVKD